MGAIGSSAPLDEMASPSRARIVGSALLAFTAVVAVLMITQDVETVREATMNGFQRPMMAAPNVQMQISQQLQKYDMAIKRVDEGIARSKLSLVAQSQKLGQATQLAVTRCRWMHCNLQPSNRRHVLCSVPSSHQTRRSCRQWHK